jgi:hypothetical protein
MRLHPQSTILERALAQVREPRNTCPCVTAQKSQNRMLILKAQHFRLHARAANKKPPS